MASPRELDLLLTCREGHTDAVLEILNANNNNNNNNESNNKEQPPINVNAEDSLGETALHICAEHGHTDVMRVLLERGANCTARTSCGWTPLHLAASCPCSTGHKGHVEAVQLLLAQSPQVINDLLHAATNDGRTALHIASLYGFTNVVRILLQKGANPSAADQDGITPFGVAIQSHTNDCIQAYLDHYNEYNYCCPGKSKSNNKSNNNQVMADFDPTHEMHWAADDQDGYTPLHLALQERRLDEVRLWLACSATASAWVNYAAATDGCTPLHAAVAHAKPTVPWLLQAGANPALADEQGWTAWHWAADEGHLGVWHILAQYGVTSTAAAGHGGAVTCTMPWYMARTLKGETCLHIASQGGHDQLCAIMTETAPSSLVHARTTTTGQTALHVACHVRQPAAVVRVLGAAGVPLAARCRRGLDALQMAKQRRQYDALYLMIHFGAAAGYFQIDNKDKNEKNKKEETGKSRSINKR